MGASSAAEAVDQQTAPERSAGRPVPRWADGAAVALYLALAFWVTSRLWRNTGALALVNGGSDVHFFEWALIHATRIFTHGENPFFTPQLNAPDGVNLMANTGLLGLTVPLVPVTLLFGPAVALTVMLTGGLAATAWAWYHVLSRHIVGYWPAALAGGLFAGFAPGMVNHVNGHPDLVSQFLIPFIVWRAISLRTARDGVVLGLLLTWQAFLNEELLFQTGLAVVVFVAAYAAFRPAEIRARAGPFLAGLWPAVLTAGVLLAYPLWFQFFGPQSYRGLPDSVLGYGTDLRAFAAFSQLSLVRHGASHSTYGAPPEENTFFGAPLLIAVGLIVVWLWRRVAVRALTAVALVFAVLSLGRTVVIGGHTVIQHGPMSLLDHLGLFDSVVPTRFGLALIPVIAILLAFSVSAAATTSQAWLRYGWTLVLAAALLPIAPTPVLVGAGPAGTGVLHQRAVAPVRATTASRFSPWTPCSGSVRSPRWAGTMRPGRTTGWSAGTSSGRSGTARATTALRNARPSSCSSTSCTTARAPGSPERSGPPSGPTCGTGAPRSWCSARTPRTMPSCGTSSTS